MRQRGGGRESASNDRGSCCDAESLRAEPFRARALEDGVRHRKLLAFALDHMGMEPTFGDVEAVERSLSALAGTCDAAVLTDLLAGVQARGRGPDGAPGVRSPVAGSVGVGMDLA